MELTILLLGWLPHEKIEMQLQTLLLKCIGMADPCSSSTVLGLSAKSPITPKNKKNKGKILLLILPVAIAQIVFKENSTLNSIGK